MLMYNNIDCLINTTADRSSSYNKKKGKRLFVACDFMIFEFAIVAHDRIDRHVAVQLNES